MSINIHWTFQVVLLDLELIVYSLVVVKGMGIFGPSWYLKFDTKNGN